MPQYAATGNGSECAVFAHLQVLLNPGGRLVGDLERHLREVRVEQVGRVALFSARV